MSGVNLEYANKILEIRKECRGRGDCDECNWNYYCECHNVSRETIDVLEMLINEVRERRMKDGVKAS